MRYIIAFFLIFITSNVFAQKTYYSDSKKLTITDMGNKTISELKTQYNATDLRDITDDIEKMVAQQRDLTIKAEEKNKLINDKIREMAISELVKEGKLNNTGNTTLGE